MAKRKIIGYQITNAEHDVPRGLYSFQLFRTSTSAFKYLNYNLRDAKGWFIEPIYEGGIEKPSYII